MYHYRTVKKYKIASFENIIREPLIHYIFIIIHIIHFVVSVNKYIILPLTFILKTITKWTYFKNIYKISFTPKLLIDKNKKYYSFINN